MDKKELRTFYRAKLNTFEKSEKERAEEQIAEYCLSNQKIQEAKTVFCYRALSFEVNTDKLIAAFFAMGKRVFLPRVSGERMVLVEVFPDSRYVKGAFSILEPLGAESIITPDITLAPLYAFDANMTRLGKGGGYYDRYFAECGGGYKIGLAFEIQKAEKLPKEEFDKKLDMVVTEEGEYHADCQR